MFHDSNSEHLFEKSFTNTSSKNETFDNLLINIAL
jgi:hypothetical protein